MLDCMLSYAMSSPAREEVLMSESSQGLDLKLAHVPGTPADNSLQGVRGVERIPVEIAPALLVSYYYLDRFLLRQKEYVYRDWVLDSGAFSAHNSGAEIKLQDFIDTAKRLMDTDGTLKEVFALDVIGNHKASLKNVEEMWRQGIEAIPTYHFGEPESLLKHLAANYPKIALGGIALQRGAVKLQWAEQCFARVWPKRIHGFGYGSEKAIMALPWDSVDATNWEFGPCGFGRWNTFGKMSVRGSNQNLRCEIEHYLKLEKRARRKFKNTYKELYK